MLAQVHHLKAAGPLASSGKRSLPNLTTFLRKLLDMACAHTISKNQSGAEPQGYMNSELRISLSPVGTLSTSQRGTGDDKFPKENHIKVPFVKSAS